MRVFWSAGSLLGSPIRATDGPAGRIGNFCFSRQTRKVEYLIIEVDSISLREVAVTPKVLKRPLRESGHVEVRLAREQIRECPGASEVLSAIPCDESDTRSSYDMAFYLGAESVMWDPEILSSTTNSPQSRLLTMTGLLGFSVLGCDGNVAGKVADFVLDETLRSVRCMTVDMGTDEHLFVASSAVSSVDLRNSKITLKHPCDKLDPQRSPSARHAGFDANHVRHAAAQSPQSANS